MSGVRGVAAVAHAIGGIDCHALFEEVRDRRVVPFSGSVPDVSTIRLQGRGGAAVPRAARLQDHPHDHSWEVVPLLASRRHPAVVTLRAFLNAGTFLRNRLHLVGNCFWIVVFASWWAGEALLL